MHGAIHMASLSPVGFLVQNRANEMNGRISVFARQSIVVLLLVTADCCIAQESERAPTPPFASNFSVDSRVASEPTTRASEAEFPEAHGSIFHLVRLNGIPN